ncbi:HTH DNA binding protein [Mycobacterium phage Quesadilla]|uniref:Helix-turn-helix DNA binding domain protein n=1 Tax=Mycobacterium phage Quesadilla TaxID=2664226 RepID=A0A5Q2WFJ7_9CAUD|nr:HTH DNA binding protein [Mycobacterium phage Quesadilla]QGH75295.1 helix-turn-helix DNA binding domain protein [Mycobacterium phage Quesadilla]
MSIAAASSTTPAPALPARAGANPHQKEIDVTTPTRERRPETHSWGLGEIIRAHRLFIGLSQREMAERVGKDRRDYQRIENGQDKCPPGLLSQVEELSDAFAYQVERVLDEAERRAERPGAGPLELAVTIGGSPGNEWDRLVAGRAAVETTETAPITLTVIENRAERSA